jgi:hypothetical protein
VLPTLTSLAGVPRIGEKPLDGRDLSPLLLNQSTEWPERMIFSTWAGRISVRTQQHRLDDQGQLFDMLADPGQTTPITERDSQTAARLQAAMTAWRADVFVGSSGVHPPARTAEQNQNRPAGGNPVDPRPIPVGYPEFPTTMLPARDGEPQGDVRRSSSAPNCSYFVNWTSNEDRMVWLLDVQTSGRYEVVIDYTCPEADVGSLVELSSHDSRLTGRVSPGWDPPLYTNQDTLPRPPAESQMKEFRPLKLGSINLKKGQAQLILRALEVPGRSVMDVRRVTLTLVDLAAVSPFSKSFHRNPAGRLP